MTEEKVDSYFANFHIWTSMAHYVAKILGLRPNEILDNWGCAELLVAFGEYLNESALEAYESWQSMYGSKKGKTPPKPRKYIVEFING